MDMLDIEMLRKHQIKPINCILEKIDSMVIAPTSAGKSATFQVPALLFEGLSLVVDPTLYLIHDQVGKLNALGINVAYLDSNLSKKERNEGLEKLKNNTLKFLYVTPERLQN